MTFPVADYGTEIADILAAGGVATAGTNLFVDRLPESPDAAVAVVMYAGGAPEFVHDYVGPAIEHPRLQIVARAVSGAAAWALAYQAYRTLAEVVNVDPYLRIIPMSAPFLLERDQNERTTYAFNVDTIRKVQ